MTDEQPRAEWVFPEPKKSNKGRIWLIVGLSVLAIAIVAVTLFFLLPRGGDVESTPSPSPSATKTASPTPTPTSTPTSTPTPTPDPTSEPEPTEPPVPDPDLATFAAQVQPRLDDASAGLSMVSGLGGQDAAQVVDQLQQDAGRLSDAAAPTSIAPAWYEGVGQYSGRLGELRGAIEAGSDAQGALDAAVAALQQLRALVGI